jgi:FixJ family two-component response regulator
MERAIVLVVAPDEGLRHSLAFALESGGFDVTIHCYAGEAFTSRHAKHAACAVVDDDAIEDWEVGRKQINSFAKPVIVLAGIFRTMPDLPFTRYLTKPFLGEPLIDAVRSAIADVL